jgi:hypothetical protein
MVFEIPEGVNIYDLIAIAVIEQAAQDASCSNPGLANEARDWLETQGKTWWEILYLGEEMFTKLVLEKADN